MFPASSKGGGMTTGFPDVCKTPAPPAPFVPIPYPNIAQVNSTDKAVDKVKILNKDTVVESSKVPRSSGDEAGTLKGMVSQKNMDQCTWKMKSSKVYAKGKKIVHHLCMTAHNGSNANLPAGGSQVAPSQTKVILMG